MSYAPLPLEVFPGHGTWGRHLESLLGCAEPIWVVGVPGSGVSRVGQELANRRVEGFLDGIERLAEEEVSQWLEVHPRGVLGLHGVPLDRAWENLVARGVVLRLPCLDEDPACLPGLVEALAQAEGLEGPLPEVLGRLPCPGQLRGLHNRILRWKLLGQLPESEGQAPITALPLDEDDVATNLHVLERLLLHRALRRSYGNRVEAARRLGVSRRQLYLLIARHGDPLRHEAPTSPGPKRLARKHLKQNSSTPGDHR